MEYVLGVCLLASITVNYLLVLVAKAERSDMQDRLMALTEPQALVTKKALDDTEPSDIDYVDEYRELELQEME
jgi:hypothetical protein